MEREDYLETIYDLKLRTGKARISDVARELGISKPSVTQMSQQLHKEGLVIYEAYGPLKLTTKGSKIARRVAERHSVLKDFLTVLCVPKSIQEKDIHGIEHFLSPITLDRLKLVVKFLKEKEFKAFLRLLR